MFFVSWWLIDSHGFIGFRRLLNRQRDAQGLQTVLRRRFLQGAPSALHALNPQSQFFAPRVVRFRVVRFSIIRVLDALRFLPATNCQSFFAPFEMLIL